MIQLFEIKNHVLDTVNYENLLHGEIVNELESKIAEYVGAKYAVSLNSASSAIFLSLLNVKVTINIPSMIPPVVLNAIINTDNKYNFIDNTNWVGDSYVLHDFGDYKIVDSAHKLHKNQFKAECNDDDLLIFSFYPTKPVSGIDGGIIVSNNKKRIDYLRCLSKNGTTLEEGSWDKAIKFPGYKMYMNSLQAQFIINNLNEYEQKLDKINSIREIYNNHLELTNTSDHLYRIHVQERDTLRKNLQNQKIMTGIHYKTLHNHTVYKMRENTVLLRSEQDDKTTLSIPFHENLTVSQIHYITRTINEYKYC